MIFGYRVDWLDRVIEFGFDAFGLYVIELSGR